jgi:hypothetical protein
LVKLHQHKAIQRLVTAVAATLIDAIEDCPLEPAIGAPALETIESAFHPRGAAARTASPLSHDAGANGPRYVHFEFVAGRRREFCNVRESVDGYGEEDGLDWKPFLPEIQDEIVQLVTALAAQEKLRPELVHADEHVVERVERAVELSKVVVIVADAWTLLLPAYDAPRFICRQRHPPSRPPPGSTSPTPTRPLTKSQRQPSHST